MYKGGEREGRDVRARDVKISVRIVSNQSMIEDERSLVRTHLLSRKVSSLRYVEDGELRILSISNSATPAKLKFAASVSLRKRYEGEELTWCCAQWERDRRR